MDYAAEESRTRFEVLGHVGIADNLCAICLNVTLPMCLERVVCLLAPLHFATINRKPVAIAAMVLSTFACFINIPKTLEVDLHHANGSLVTAPSVFTSSPVYTSAVIANNMRPTHARHQIK